MVNTLCHFEFCATDVERTKRFYANLFSWQFDDTAMPGHTLIRTGGEPGGGLMRCTPDMPGPCLNVFFHVDDIAATIALAERAGGKVAVPETPIPNVGAFAMISDPDGLLFDIFADRKG